MNKNFNITDMIKATACVAAAFISCSPQATAIPAYPFPIAVTQPDGSTVSVRLLGDEHHHVMVSENGDYVMGRDVTGKLVQRERFDRAEFERKSRAVREWTDKSPKLLGSTSFPSHGKQRALAILVEYPETDETPEGRRFFMSNPREHFYNMLNADNYAEDGATGSVHEYFYDASSGVFDLTFDVYGPITLEHDVSYYTKLTNGENLSAWHMAEEACRAIDDDVDFSEYDRDNDGIIDNVYIFYAGEGGATSAHPETCIWQHAADIEQITGMQFRFDGLRLNHYACSNEYRLVTNASGEVVRQAEGIGTVCHEFSHVLGLPDFYDTRNHGTSTPGPWAIMDTGCHLNDSRTPPHFTAIERVLMGWLTPTVIGTEPQKLTLRPVYENEAYRINTSSDKEYFLLENRQQTGWDAFIPGHGLLVWHIYQMDDYWNANQVNTVPATPGIDIVRADGTRGDNSLAGDPFPGSSKVTSLTDEGYPHMMSYGGEATGAPISGIVEAGGNISFDICKSVTSLGKVDGLVAKNVTPTGFTAAWNAVPYASGYVLSVFTRQGSEVVYAGVYHDLNVSANSVEVSGLSPETEYFFTVRAVAGTVSGAVSDECGVTTPAMSFAFSAPDGLEASDVQSQSFMASWQPLEGAVDYDVTLCTAKAGEPKQEVVDFTDGIAGLPSGWFTNTSFVLSMKGYYGQAAPALSLPDDYGRVQSPVLSGDLEGLKFWYRERSGAGDSKIEISVLQGTQWIEVEKIEIGAKMSAGVSYELPASKIASGARAVRIVYRKGSKGSLALDDIVVTYAGESVKTPVNGWNNRKLGSSDARVLVDGLTASTAYYFTVRGIDATGAPSSSSRELKVTTGSSSGTDEITVPEYKVSISADGVVSVDGCDQPVSVCDIQGREVGTRLPSRGFYILRAGAFTAKIVY